MKLVVQATGDELPVAARQAQHQLGRLGDVERCIGQRHLVRQSLARSARLHPLVWHHDHSLQPHGRLQPLHVAGIADDEPALQRSRDVVRVTLQLDCKSSHVCIELKDVIGCKQASQNRRGAGSQSPAEGNLGVDRELKRIGWVEALKGPHHEIRAVARQLELGLYSEAACLANLDLQVQRQRSCQHVKTRSEIARGGGDAHDSPSLERH